MKNRQYISASILLLLTCTCKKVTKQVNSEKPFSIFVVDSQNVPQNMCFDRVWGNGRANLTSCTNFKEGIKLPLNIQTDTSMFFFKTGTKTDTITLLYTKRYEPASGEFEVIFNIQQIKTTFSSLSLKCITDLTPKCNGDQAYLSATIYQ